MKRLLTAVQVAALSVVVLAGVAQADDMKMAVTTSFHNSGLAEVLLPEIQKDLDLEVQLLVVGTGQALKLGRAGDVDAILVHSRGAEEKFVAEGYGPHRREIMYNDFVVIGPAADPAGIKGATDAKDALGKIAAAQVLFVSRGMTAARIKRNAAFGQMPGLNRPVIGIAKQGRAWGRL